MPDSGGVFLCPRSRVWGRRTGIPTPAARSSASRAARRPAHIARAALDSIALQVADLADAMRSDAATAGSADPHSRADELRVDGGASVNDACCSIQADILQLPVVRPKVTETTALGAAYLAGLAAGVWKSREAIADHWQVDRRFEPQMSADEATAIRARWSRRRRSFARLGEGRIADGTNAMESVL